MKKRYVSIIACIGLSVSVAFFAGCGGGNGGTSSDTISGTAATGKAISNGMVYLMDNKGHKVNVETGADGKFKIDSTNLTPPFLLKVPGYELFSFTKDQNGTVNITPLTTAIVKIAYNGDVNESNISSDLNITSVADELKKFLKNALEEYNISNADFISTPFKANHEGMDALLDSIDISVESNGRNKQRSSRYTQTSIGISVESNGTIVVKNRVTGDTIGEGDFSEGKINISDEITENEVDNLPQPGSMIHKKYFAYVEDNYGSGKEGPVMIDIYEVNNSVLGVKITAIKGDTGDTFLIYGKGAKNGDDINFSIPAILCNDTNPDGNGTAIFSGTIGLDGVINGSFVNTLSAGDTCKVNGNSVYEGTFTAEDVTDDQPANVAGKYDGYVTHEGWEEEEGPASIEINQTSNIISVSITVPEGDSDESFTVTGSGMVYGNYLTFQLPIITCHDTCTCPDGSNCCSGDDCNESLCPDAENATFFLKAERDGSLTGIVGDGVPEGDYCKARDYDNTNHTIPAIGQVRAVKK